MNRKSQLEAQHTGARTEHLLDSAKIDLERLTVLSRELLTEIEAALILQGVRRHNGLHRAHFTAMRNWLGKYQASVGAPGREKVRGYREAGYHLREIGAWRQSLRLTILGWVSSPGLLVRILPLDCSPRYQRAKS